VGNPGRPALVCRAGSVDRAETDAPGKMGKPLPDFTVLEPPSPGADTGPAQEIWFRVQRAILVRMAPAGIGAPVISGWITLLIYPCFFLALKWFAHWLGDDTNPPGLFLFPVWVTPILLSILLAPALAVFDPLQTKGELPVYIAVRPTTDGSIVLAKLVMAVAMSALTGVITAASTCLWLVLLGTETLFSKAGLVTPYGPVDCLTWCVPALLLMILWIWKNLVAGIGAGLTGRTPGLS